MKICGLIVVIIIVLGVGKLWKRRVFLILLGAAGACLAAAAFTEYGQGTPEITSIEKQKTGGGTQEMELLAEVGEEEVNITVTVPERNYTAKEAKEILAAEKSQLPQRILGENGNAERIDHDLVLAGIGENAAVSIVWYCSDPETLNWEGRIGDHVPEEGTEVRLSAVLSLQGYEEHFAQTLTVFPRAATGDLKTDIETQLRLANDDAERAEYVLPESVNGQKIYWYEAPENTAAAAAALILIAGICLYLSERQKDDEKRRKRQEALDRQYPDMVSRLMLMMYAGTGARRAFFRMAVSYSREKAEGKRRHEVFEEVIVMCREMENGVTEVQAYENLGERCALPAYRTLSVLLVQNLKRGGAGMMNALEQEVVHAFGEKKRKARMAGDAASLKLLLPLCLMLLVAFALMLIPAFLSL